MTSQAVLEILKSMDFFEATEPDHLERLAAIAKIVEFGPDKIIFREGEVGDTVYLIEDGRVAVEIFVPSRGRTTVLTLGPGQLLGWSPLFSAKPNTATGRTLAPTRALALDAAELRSLCEKDHVLGCVFGWRLAEVIAGRLKATRLQLLDIFAHEK
jgi:CRP-like cAMP-binding protein